MRGKLEFVFSRIFRYMLFVSSYLPLFVILFLMNIESLLLSLILTTLMILTLLTLKWYIDYPLKIQPNKRVVLSEISNKGSEALNYLVTYIIPFISFNSNIFEGKQGLNLPTLIAFIILFLVMGNLYMYNNLYHINPILTLFYDIHTANEKNGRGIIVISEKGNVIPLNTTIFMRSLSPGVVLHTEGKKNKLSYLKIVLFLLLLLLFLVIWNAEFQEYIIMSKDFILNLIRG